METLPLLASTDTSATFGGKLLEFMDLVGHPDSVGFEWSTTDADMTDSSDSLFVFDAGTLAADSTYTIELPFQFGTLAWYRFFAINESGTKHGQTVAFEVKSPPCGALTAVTFDGYDYDLVEIGDQCWFAENLRSTNYADGQGIDEVTDGTTWAGLSAGARCDYDNAPSNVATYGRMYNWYAVTDSCGLCPSGWHVPTDAEFTELANFLGGSAVAGEKMKASASDSPAWNGTNSSGWSGLPGGYRNVDGYFQNAGDVGSWWSSSPSGSYVWSRFLSYDFPYVFRIGHNLRFGFSIRCLRDSD